jgi:hypothetical protein
MGAADLGAAPGMISPRMEKGAQPHMTDAGMVTRYFLRRYAQARRNLNNATPSVPFRAAVLEAGFLFVMLPFLSLYSVFLITSLRWPLLNRAYLDEMADKYLAIALSFALLAGWYFIVARKFQRYRVNPRLCAEFDSERDRNIILWQKAVGLIVAGLVIPLLACAVTFWPF